MKEIGRGSAFGNDEALAWIREEWLSD
jgi:hypothetical protein